MTKQKVPVNYGNIDIFHPFYRARHELFPNDDSYRQGGCMISTNSPNEIEVYVCPECTKAQLVFWETMIKLQNMAVEEYRQEQEQEKKLTHQNQVHENIATNAPNSQH